MSARDRQALIDAAERMRPALDRLSDALNDAAKVIYDINEEQNVKVVEESLRKVRL